MNDGKHEYEVCGVIADYHSGDALSENEKTNLYIDVNADIDNCYGTNGTYLYRGKELV